MGKEGTDFRQLSPTFLQSQWWDNEWPFEMKGPQWTACFAKGMRNYTFALNSNTDLLHKVALPRCCCGYI